MITCMILVLPPGRRQRRGPAKSSRRTPRRCRESKDLGRHSFSPRRAPSLPASRSGDRAEEVIAYMVRGTRGFGSPTLPPFLLALPLTRVLRLHRAKRKSVSCYLRPPIPSPFSVVCWAFSPGGSMPAWTDPFPRGRRQIWRCRNRSGPFSRASRRTYGAPRVHAELGALGVRCGRKRGLSLVP